MRGSTFFSLLLLAGLVPFTGVPFLVPPVCADESWRSEFEAVCAQTDVSMSLSKEELKDLILRCEKLKSRIELEEETVRKVFLRRIQTCRDLFVYILESKDKGSITGESTPHPSEKSK